MTVAIVILNWNGKALLEKFIPYVVKFSGYATIYVADNASTDGSVDFLKLHFPQVNIIKNKINGGYAKGYNDALKNIEADIFCLLNNDVEVTANWLEPIITTFKTDANTAIIQPKLLDYKNRSYFEYAGAAGGYIDKFGYPYCRGRIFNTVEKDTKQYDNNCPILWASGACLFIKSEIFKTLGGFDESYFAHMEEIDLCWRAHNLGYAINYIGNSTVYHVGGATLSNTNPQKTYLNFRNSLFTLVKNTNQNLCIIIFARLVLDGLAGVMFLTQLKPLHTIAILKAHFSFYHYLKILLKKRKTILKRKDYYHKTSIVWLYFVNNKKHFSKL